MSTFSDLFWLTGRGCCFSLSSISRSQSNIYRNELCQQQIHILQVKDGKLTEHRVIRDGLTVLQQLGVITLPDQARLPDQASIAIPSEI